MARFMWTLAILVVLGGASASGQVLYVDADRPPGGNGSTWGTAYDDLADALTHAAGDGSIEEIWIAEGTYTPAPPGGSRFATFSLFNDIALYGGFDGTEAQRDQRDPTTFASILSGDLNGNDGPNWTNTSDNSYHVTTANGVGPSCVLDGITITAGNADKFTGVDKLGGGMLAQNGAPTFTNVRIYRNQASRAFGEGGGIYTTSSNTVYTDCVIEGNRALAGGGIRMTSSAATFLDCTIEANEATSGAGIDSSSGISCEFTRCLFVLNDATGGGGALLFGGTVIVTDTVFDRNHATSGAGFEMGGCTSTFTNCDFLLNDTTAGGGFDASGGSVTVTVSRFHDNEATSGGGLSAASMRVTISDCEFLNNDATGGGGVSLTNCNASSITDCVFMDGDSTGGGGVDAYDSSVDITRCHFERNHATSGGGLSIEGTGTSLVTDCTFVANTATVGAGASFGFDTIATLRDSMFDSNVAASGGGGLSADGAFNVVEDCFFVNNRARSTGGGASAHADDGAIRRCLFAGNIVEDDDAGGGGGGLWISITDDLRVEDCTFLDNIVRIEPPPDLKDPFQPARGGSAVFFSSSDAELVNCEVIDNRTESSGVVGGAIYCRHASPRIFNCTVTGSVVDSPNALEGSALFAQTTYVVGSGRALPSDPVVFNSVFWANDGAEIGTHDVSTASADFSCIEGGYPGTGNIDQDPLFADPPGDNYRLSETSPCIDSGDNASVPPGITTDREGNPRIVDGDGDSNAVVDMGAFEFSIPRDCRPGNVNESAGAPTDVLLVDGSAGGEDRTVEIPAGTQFTMALEEAPQGSGSGVYVLWAWLGSTDNPVDLVAGGGLIGCIVNPTPLNVGLSPQPKFCLAGQGIPQAACEGTRPKPAPDFAPWSVTKSVGAAVTVTLQGLMKDVSSPHPKKFSVTNAVTLVVQ